MRPDRDVTALTPFGEASARPWTLRDVTAAIRRRARVAIIACAALSAGAVAAVVTAPSVYEGDFKILVKSDRADAVITGADAGAVRQETLSESELLSQVELIKATDLLKTVAQDAGLTTRLLAEGDARTDAEALALATDNLRRDLSVEPIRKTWLIDVAYADPDPAITRGVLESLVRRYLEKHLALHRPAGTYAFFSEQAGRARRELDEAQARLTAFTQEHGVVSADQEKQAVLQKLAEFDAMRAQAAAELAATSERLTEVRTQLSQVPPQRTSEVRIMENSGVAQDIQSRILSLEMERTELIQRFTPEYRGIVEIDQQLRDARAALASAQRTPIKEETVADNPTRLWLDTERARARTDETALRARLGSLAASVARYRRQAQSLEVQDGAQDDLLRDLQAAESRYQLYAQKQEEARISDELDRTRIANVVVAQEPSLAFKPRRRPSLAMLPLLLGVAVLLSLALALVVDAVAGFPGAPATAGLLPGATGFATVPAADSSVSIDAVMQRAQMSTARLVSRLEALKAITDEVDARWAASPVAPTPPPAAEPRGEAGTWTVIPATQGLRQGA